MIIMSAIIHAIETVEKKLIYLVTFSQYNNF